jgi:hypothetical protein
MGDITRRTAFAAGVGALATAVAVPSALQAADKETGGGAHIVTYGEVKFDGTTPTVVNDSGDFTVEFNSGQHRFTLKFERDISRTVISLTPFFQYVGDSPYLSIHAARQGPKELGVVISSDNAAFSREGCGFWIMMMYLKNCPE